MLLASRDIPFEVHGGGRFVIPDRDFAPAYLRTYEEGRLRDKVEEALEALRDCTLCPRNCHVDRLADRFAVCKVGRYARVSSFFPHFGEEDVLRGWAGSGTIFFAWCNLRCVFCLHPDTRVLTDQGLVRIAHLFERARAGGKPLEECVRLVDGKVRVVTRNGTWAPVTKVFRHRFVGALVRIEPYNCPPMLLTPDHEVFAVRNGETGAPRRVRADVLTPGDLLLVPRRVFQLPAVRDLLPRRDPPLQMSPPRRTPAEALEGVFARSTTSLELAVLTGSHPGHVRRMRGADAGSRPAQLLEEREAKPAPGRWRAAEDYHLVPIHRVERVPYEGPVFNLEVDDPDHSYLAPLVAVGNCQNYETSQMGEGVEVTPRDLAAMMLRLQELGCHNINFVTPEHVVPQILEALPYAIEGGLRVPLVYNTSSYDSLHSIRLMDGVVDVYMPDFKLWHREHARKYLLAPDYPEVAREVIRAMHQQVGVLRVNEDGLARRGVLVRHLVMPGLLEDTREILRWLAELSPDTYVNVMDQYRPAWKARTEAKYAEIGRPITSREYEAAVRFAREAGLWRIDSRWRRGPHFVLW